MTTDVLTLPGETTTVGMSPPRQGVIQETSVSSCTMLAPFEAIAHLLSQRELRRPRRPSPSGEELKRIAKKHQPPPEWYEGEDDRPF